MTILHRAIAAALLASGCASAPAVPLRGAPAAVASLAGEWDGTYSSRATGRSGSIWFKLIDGEDHAHGDVVMTAAGASTAYGRQGPEGYLHPSDRRPPNEAFLTIRFVRAADGRVDGVLDPYWDPACACWVLTAFHGEIGDGRVAGTFVSRFGESIASGRWEVTRRRSRSH
ncbi:MAG TPA: hypothetical protein VFK57_25025 [Vicinamibacterales bacterium]|nr:hypothetical protein [Vicinamibacterales bacterium]